jgi:hypothetical protein
MCAKSHFHTFIFLKRDASSFTMLKRPLDHCPSGAIMAHIRWLVGRNGAAGIGGKLADVGLVDADTNAALSALTRIG